MQLNDLKLPFFLWRIKNGKHLHFVYAQSHISDSFIFTREPLNCRGRHHDQLSEFENKRIIGMMKIRFSVLPIKAFLKQIFDRMHQREVTNTTVRLRAFSTKQIFHAIWHTKMTTAPLSIIKTQIVPLLQAPYYCKAFCSRIFGIMAPNACAINDNIIVSVSSWISYNEIGPLQKKIMCSSVTNRDLSCSVITTAYFVMVLWDKSFNSIALFCSCILFSQLVWFERGDYIRQTVIKILIHLTIAAWYIVT